MNGTRGSTNRADCCPTCGSRYATWTPEALIAAAQKQAARLGHAPNSETWHKASPENPSLRTVYRHFASWDDFMAAAGLTGIKASRRKWTREDAERALLVWKFEHGRLPTSSEWNVGVNHNYPTRSQVRQLYGSWNAFLVAGGYEPVSSRRSVDSYRKSAGNIARGLGAAA